MGTCKTLKIRYRKICYIDYQHFNYYLWRLLTAIKYNYYHNKGKSGAIILHRIFFLFTCKRIMCLAVYLILPSGKRVRQYTLQREETVLIEQLIKYLI